MFDENILAHSANERELDFRSSPITIIINTYIYAISIGLWLRRMHFIYRKMFVLPLMFGFGFRELILRPREKKNNLDK